MRSTKRTWIRLLSAVVCAAVLLPVSVAAGAESTPTAPADTPPVAGAVDAQFWMDGNPGEAVAIVSVTLDGSVQLPAVVRIPVIEGMVVDWAGEISDTGDINQDIERTYVLKDGAGGKYVEMRLTKFREGQIDLSGKPLTVTGTDVSATFKYVQTAPAVQTGFAVRLPPGASDVKIDPKPAGQPNVNAGGESLYSLSEKSMKVGEEQVVSVAYSTAGKSSAGSSAGGSLTTLLWVLVAAVVVVGFILVWSVSKQRRSVESAVPGESKSPRAADQTSASAPQSSDIDDRDDPFLLDD